MAKKEPTSKRDETIAFKASAAERRAYEAAAEKDDRNLSQWMRHVLNVAAGLKK